MPANRWLWGAVVLNGASGIAAVTWPLLGHLLRLAPMTVLELLVVVPAVAVCGTLARRLRVVPATALPATS